MNVYDEANNLAKALKQCHEYKKFKEAKEKLSKNQKYTEMVKDYTKKQFEIQSLQMMGKELNETQIDSFNSMTSNLMAIPDIAEFFQAQILIARIMQDISKTLADAVDMNLDFFDEK